jgi:hypothetical protein
MSEIDPTEFSMHPIDVPDRKRHIGNICVGILLQRYPAPKGSLMVVTQESIVKYGPKLGTALDNMFTECLTTGRTIYFRILWQPDGSPQIEASTKLIIQPTDLDTLKIAREFHGN